MPMQLCEAEDRTGSLLKYIMVFYGKSGYTVPPECESEHASRQIVDQHEPPNVKSQRKVYYEASKGKYLS